MPTNHIDSVTRVFDIIEQLADTRGATITTLSGELGMAKSTVHIHLKTLESLGFVEKDSKEQYHLSLEFLVIGGIVREYRTIYKFVRPLLDDIASTTSESASFVVEHNDRYVLIDNVKGEDGVKTKVHLGISGPLHTTPEGKLLLAHLPTERQEPIFEGIEFPVNGMDETAFRENLQDIKEAGYAFAHDSIISNVTAIAVPVTDNDNKLYGIIVVTGPKSHFDAERIEKIVELLLVKVGELNISLSHEMSETVSTDSVVAIDPSG